MSQATVRRLAVAALLLAAAIFGSTYVVLKILVDRIPPTDVMAIRFTIAAVFMVIVAPQSLKMSRRTLKQGTIMGLLFGIAGVLQGYGIADTSASIAGFITGMYVVFTPLLAALFGLAKVRLYTWLAVILAGIGLASLSYDPQAGGISIGAVLVLISAIGYAAHIVVTGHASSPQTVLSLATVQAIVMALVCLALAAPDRIVLPSRGIDWLCLAYLGILGGAVTTLLQTWGQIHVDATSSAIILCSEPLWSAIIAMGMGLETLSPRITFGGIVIVGAMLLTSVSGRRSTPIRRA